MGHTLLLAETLPCVGSTPAKPQSSALAPLPLGTVPGTLCSPLCLQDFHRDIGGLQLQRE